MAAAATDAIKVYGPEIYTLLTSLHRDDADDVFSQFCEKLWKGLPRPSEGLHHPCSTWALGTVAWSSLLPVSHCARRRGARCRSPTSQAILGRWRPRFRSETRSRMRNERRSRLREIRQTLLRRLKYQLLLVLRVERELDWKRSCRG